MSFEFDAPEDIAPESTYLSEPGVYHFIVTAITEGANKQGTPINGFYLSADALGGTVDDAEGKSFGDTIFYPDMSRTEKQVLAAKRKLAAFFIAADLMTADQLGKPCKIELQDAIGRQIVIKVERQMEKDGNGEFTIATKFLQINYSDIYHVDDPAVGDGVLNAEYVARAAKEHRHPAEYFAFKKKAKAAPKPKPADDFDGF